MSGTAPVRRLAPPDRNAPVFVAQRACPFAEGCYCCPDVTAKKGPERATEPQDNGRIACCVECGRVTARRWTDPEGRLLPWCAGQQTES